MQAMWKVLRVFECPPHTPEVKFRSWMKPISWGHENILIIQIVPATEGTFLQQLGRDARNVEGVTNIWISSTELQKSYLDRKWSSFHGLLKNFNYSNLCQQRKEVTFLQQVARHGSNLEGVTSIWISSTALPSSNLDREWRPFHGAMKIF